MTTDSHPKNFWRKLFTRFVLTFLMVMIGLCVIGPYTKLFWAQHELNQAKQNWMATRPITYQVTVRSRNFISGTDSCDSWYEPYTITVTNGEVVASNAPLNCKAIYQQLTVEKSFGQIEHYLKAVNPVLTTAPTLQFDNHYHFVSYFTISQISSSTEDSVIYVSFEDFK